MGTRGRMSVGEVPLYSCVRVFPCSVTAVTAAARHCRARADASRASLRRPMSSDYRVVALKEIPVKYSSGSEGTAEQPATMPRGCADATIRFRLSLLFFHLSDPRNARFALQCLLSRWIDRG